MPWIPFRAVHEQIQLGIKWGTGREGAGEPTRTQLSALVAIFQRGQGRQALWHVVIELGQALLLVVLICTRLHCNENHRINHVLWMWLQTLEMAPQIHLEISLSTTSPGSFLLQYSVALGKLASFSPLDTLQAMQPTSLCAQSQEHSSSCGGSQPPLSTSSTSPASCNCLAEPHLMPLVAPVLPMPSMAHVLSLSHQTTHHYSILSAPIPELW